MMHAYRTEGSYRSAARMTAAELRAAMASREILQSTALAFDTQRQLRFELGGVKAVMPFCPVRRRRRERHRAGHCRTDPGRPPHLLCH